METTCTSCGGPSMLGRRLCGACEMKETLARRPGGLEARYAAGPAALARTNGWAIASLVLGIVAWFGFPFLGAIAAVWTGYRARSEIRASGEHGKELATAGIVLGVVQLALVALAAVIVLVVVLVAGAAVLHGL